MSLQRPSSISGLDTEHALYSNVRQFLDFATLTELVADSSFTCDGTLADDDGISSPVSATGIGPSRLITNSNYSTSENLSVSDGNTILVVFRHNGSHLQSEGDAARIFFWRLNTGDACTFSYRPFSSFNYELELRGDFSGGSAQENQWAAYANYTLGNGYYQPHAAAVTVNPSNASQSTTMYFDGSEVPLFQNEPSGSAFSSTDISVPVIPMAPGVNSDTYLGAIIVFDKILTPSELASVTTDPWALVVADVQAPAISDVDTDESIYPGQDFDITGVNFGSTQGSVSVDGVSYTVNSWSDTSINATAVRGGNNYGSGKTLTVTTDAADSADITITQEAEPGAFVVTASSPNTEDDASLWSELVDTVTGDPVTIVNADQALIKNPNSIGNLSVDPDGTISADEEGDFVVQIWLASEGSWGSDQTVTFEVPQMVPQGTVVVGTITKDHESASIPFTYAESDANSFEHSTNGTDWTTVTSPISRTGLDAETAYSGQIRAVNATGAATPVSYNFTTDAEPVTAPTDAPVIGTITKDHESASIPFSSVTGATAYEYSTDSATWTDVTSPLVLSSLTAETAYSGQIRGYNSAGPGPSATYSFTTDAEPLMPPSGTLSFGAASVTTTTISLPTSYDAADADSFEYRVDDGVWTTYTSPIALSGLNSETTYAIDAKPVNADGDGTIISTTVTTLAASGAPLERQYTLVAGIDSLPQAQQFTIYQGERVRFIIDHDMDLTDRTMILRIAPALGSPAKVSVNANDSQFLITSAISEEMSPANKVWQILVKQGDERVVVADGTAVVKQRIKEQ